MIISEIIEVFETKREIYVQKLRILIKKEKKISDIESRSLSIKFETNVRNC